MTIIPRAHGARAPPMPGRHPGAQPSIFGPWLFREITPPLQMASALAKRDFRALPKAVGEFSGTLSHASKRTAGRGSEALHTGARRPLVAPVLQHAAARSKRVLRP